MRHRFGRTATGVAGLVVLSATAKAHGGVEHGSVAVAFVVVLVLPTLAGFAGGLAAVRYSGLRRPEATRAGSSIAVGFLLVGLGTAMLLQAVTGGLRLSVAGGTAGAAVTLLVTSKGKTSGTGCGNHAELTLVAIFTHRLLEGVVLGTLYSTGAAVGLLGAVVLAGHTVVETAAVGGLYATASRPAVVVGAVVLVQVGYVVGAAAGLAAVDAVPASGQTLVFAVGGGTLLAVGARETERSVAAGGAALVG